MGLVESSVLDAGAVVIIATHSTALLGALNESQARVAFMTRGSKALAFSPISEQLRDILPIFGAHPLTNIFGERPILLVEGEDDVRIWQQAARSSHGRIKIWPSAVGDIQSLERYENVAADIIGAVYDNAVAYSLRDRDDASYEIDDKPHVIRMRLYCRSAENLILSDDVLALLGTDWLAFQECMRDWVGKNGDHSQFASVKGFAEGFDRVGAAVKDLRNLFMVIAGSNKPWEVAVGQSIAGLNSRSSQAEGSLISMLGPKAVKSLRLN